jgi:GT2 family glycosyltransferase
MPPKAIADQTVRLGVLVTASDSNVVADVIVVTYNSVPCIEPCLKSILEAGARVVLVDNGSQDETVELVRVRYPSVRLLSSTVNRGYAGAINAGYALTRSRHVIISNADVVFPSGSMSRLCDYLDQHPEAGVVGPQLVFSDGSWQESYCSVPSLWEGFSRLVGLRTIHNWRRRLLWPRKTDRRPKSVGYVVGAVMAIRRETFEICRGWDETFQFYAEDVDFCERVRRANFAVHFLPDIEVVHAGGASSSRIDSSGRFTQIWSDSVMIFIRRRYSERLARVYAGMQALHFRQLAFACALLALIAPQRARTYFRARSQWFGEAAATWCRQLHFLTRNNAQ